MATVVTQDKTALYVKDWGVGRPVILHKERLSDDIIGFLNTFEPNTTIR